MVGINVALINQGRPKQSSMSNVLDPIELLIPIDPCPKKNMFHCKHKLLKHDFLVELNWKVYKNQDSIF